MSDLVALALAVQPVAYAGCYSLHLYCKYENPEHGFGAFPVEIDGYERGTQARAAARRRGWIIHPDRTATCPKCARRLKSNPLPKNQ